MGKRTVTAIVDDREPESLIAEVSTHDEVEDWRVERLDVGDIQFEESDVIVERKTASDYNSSLTSGHIRSQITEMAQVTDHAYVIVEDDMAAFRDREYGDLPPESVRGSMASFMIRDGVPIVPVGTQGDLVDLAIRLSRKSVEDPGVRGLDSGAVDRSEPFPKRVLGLIPSIGPDTAETVYSRYETMEELMRVEEDELTELDGIGPKTAERIVAWLHDDQDSL